MDISSLTNISSDYLNQIAQQNRLVTTDDDSFSSVLSSAMNMVSETNNLQNNAQSEAIRLHWDSQRTHMICQRHRPKHLLRSSIRWQ